MGYNPTDYELKVKTNLIYKTSVYFITHGHYTYLISLALEGASRPSSKLIVNMFSLCTS